jgi:hypothetical protein
MKGQSLESILITPVQRVPRYRLLLQELAKVCIAFFLFFCFIFFLVLLVIYF